MYLLNERNRDLASFPITCLLRGCTHVEMEKLEERGGEGRALQIGFAGGKSP